MGHLDMESVECGVWGIAIYLDMDSCQAPAPYEDARVLALP